MPPHEGLSITFDLLARTENEAATGLLLHALESPDRHVSEAALRTLLKRHSLAGHQQLLRRLHALDPHWREILHEYRGTMSHALRDALVSSDGQSCANSCQAILWFHEYDLMPALINVLENESNPNAPLAAETALKLAELFYDDLAGTHNFRPRQDPRTLRGHLVSTLEASVMRYARHRRNEPVEAFLMLCERDNATLKQLLFDPLHASYRPVIETLTHGTRPGVLRLLLSSIDDPQAPSAALTAIAHRRDAPFVKALLRKIGSEPSATAKRNLARIEHFAWLRPNEALLDELDDAAQHSVVELVMASGMNRLEAFDIIAHLMAAGTVGGRRAAVAALAQFHGSEANNVALKALADDDPQVQSAVLSQLRERGIPGAVSLLVELAESSEPSVRQAARQSLSEFSFARYLAAFDMLEDQVRRSTGMLVRKVDPDAVPQLIEEMQALSRRRRIRALQVAEAMQVVKQLEAAVIARIEDEDHLVRLEAARALGQCDSANACLALRTAERDTSLTVREAATDSLEKLYRRRPEMALLADSIEAADNEPAVPVEQLEQAHG
ncbi:MAG TPA: HEAT repeat domain-containing protein [Pirellulales bacterium]|nr:HEAT repeat domain-containing protein [Pirellulales bacterium]